MRSMCLLLYQRLQYKRRQINRSSTVSDQLFRITITSVQVEVETRVA